MKIYSNKKWKYFKGCQIIIPHIQNNIGYLSLQMRHFENKQNSRDPVEILLSVKNEERSTQQKLLFLADKVRKIHLYYYFHTFPCIRDYMVILVIKYHFFTIILVMLWKLWNIGWIWWRIWVGRQIYYKINV